jgi:hypothetical protein
MNERIRLLSEQAHRSTADELAHLQRVHNRTYDLNESAAIYNEKFAELIVAECAQIAVFKDSGTVATADVAGHMAAGRSIAARLIREHFGVAE